MELPDGFLGRLGRRPAAAAPPMTAAQLAAHSRNPRMPNAAVRGHDALDADHRRRDGACPSLTTLRGVAGALICSETGCAVTDAVGEPLDFSLGRGLEKNRGILAAPPRVHGLLLGAIKELTVPGTRPAGPGEAP